MLGCLFAQAAQHKMPFRLYCLGIIALATVSFGGGTFAQAPVATDFTAWKDPRNAESVPDWARRMLDRDFRNVVGTARKERLARTLAALKDIASDNDSVPSTRYNAILAAGQLVSVAPNPGTGTLPVAYADALLYLIEVYQDPDAPHYLKYGALLGLVRHTNIGIDPAQQNTVIDLLLDIVTTEFKTGEITLDTVPLESAAWDWFRLTALDGLAALKTVGPEGKVVTGLLSVINRQSLELEDLSGSQNAFTREEWKQSRRSAELGAKAAKTLGDLNYAEAPEIDAKKITDAFVRLTKAVCGIEHKIVSDFLEPSERGGTVPNPVLLLEQIVINVKMSIQSVVWGIRSSFLTGRPTEDSFYASLESDDPAVRRLDILLAEIIKLSIFLDEGDGTRRPVLSANVPREFQFGLPELRDTLAKTSETLTEILREEKEPKTVIPDVIMSPDGAPPVAEAADSDILPDNQKGANRVRPG